MIINDFEFYPKSDIHLGEGSFEDLIKRAEHAWAEIEEVLLDECRNHDDRKVAEMLESECLDFWDTFYQALDRR